MATVVGGTVTWNLKVNADKFKRSISNASVGINKFAKNLKKQDSAVKKSGEILKRSEKILKKQDGAVLRLSKSIKNLAVGYLSFKAVAGTLRFLGGVADSFRVQDLAVARLNASLQNVTGTTEEHIKQLLNQAAALQKVTTFGDEQIISAQALLGTFQQNKEAIGILTPRILDMAASLEKTSGAQVDLESITLAVGKAMTNGVGSLSRYGVVISEAAKEAFSLADEQEKVNIIAQELDKNFKGIAEGSARTLTGGIRQMANEFGDAKERVGGVVTFLKLNLMEAFVTSAGGMTLWGENALKISKQVADAFFILAKNASFAMQGISSSINIAKVALQGLEVAGLKASKINIKLNNLFPGRAKLFPDPNTLDGIDKRLSEIANETNNVIDNQSNLNKLYEEARMRLQENRTELEGLNTPEDFFNLGLAFPDRVEGLKETGQQIKKIGDENTKTAEKITNAAKQISEELKKEAEAIENASEKVINFRQKELDMSDRIKDAMQKQKLAIADLKEEYDRAISSIKQNIDELNASFDKSESSARGSFLGQLASASQTARDTIKAREKMIQTELNNGDQADQAKIANLRALNAKEQAILDANSGIIGEADKIAAEKKTAVGVQNLINRFAAEREEAQKNFEREKSELNRQLEDKEAQFKESNLAIKTDTIDAIADIRSSYLRMFDDIHRELSKLGEKFLELLTLGAISAPGPSAASIAEFAKLKFDNGGIVPGPRGAPQLAMVHGGETILPTHKSAGAGSTFNFNISEKVDMTFILEEVKRVLGADALESAFGVNK